ncbi:MAG: hypothetical protein KJN99_08695 [Marinicaulis sp.]|nr:hypothetical protein [Marinicaulis sp.]
MCEIIGFIHLIIPKWKFNLIQGADNIVEYTFNKIIAKHFFCVNCGVKSFYVPRSNPVGYSLNLRCMKYSQFLSVEIVPLDGKNWEENAGKLAHLSEES